MPVTPTDVDNAVPSGGIPNRGLTNTVLKGLITDIAAVGVGVGVGTVNTFADLPAPATVSGERWWVLTSTGVWLVNRKTKGAYYSDGAAWSYLGDFPVTAVEIGNVPAGGIAAVDVQGAIDELDTDKAPKGDVTTSGLTMATARLLGRSTAATGAIEEITLGTNLSFTGTTLNASGGGGGSITVEDEGTPLTTAVTLFDFAGSGVTVTEPVADQVLITIPGTPDPITLSSAPTAPASGSVSIGETTAIDRFSLPSYMSATGVEMPLQPFFGAARMTGFIAGGTTLISIGGAVTSTGTVAAQVVTSTNVQTRTPRLRQSTNATAGNLTTAYSTSTQAFMGGSAVGGFFVTAKYVLSTDVAGSRQFLGISSAVNAPTNVNPSTLTNSIGLAVIDSSNNLHIVYGGSAAQTPIDLGADYPGRTNGEMYELRLYSDPNDNTQIWYRVIRNNGAFDTGAVSIANTTPGTTLPATTTALSLCRWFRTNNATASITSYDPVHSLGFSF